MTINDKKLAIFECCKSGEISIAERDALLSYIEERAIISDKHFMNNIDKWGPGYPLFITGTSGDGKSTLAAKYEASRSNALLVHTDTFLCRLKWPKEKYEARMSTYMNTSGYRVVGDEMSLDFISQHPELPYDLHHLKGEEAGDNEIDRLFIIYLNWIIENSKKNPKYNTKSIIVEGCDICLMDPMLMAQYPLIILGYSKLVTAMHRIKRDYQEDHNIIDAIFSELSAKRQRMIKGLNDNKEFFYKMMNVTKNL